MGAKKGLALVPQLLGVPEVVLAPLNQGTVPKKGCSAIKFAAVTTEAHAHKR